MEISTLRDEMRELVHGETRYFAVSGEKRKTILDWLKKNANASVRQYTWGIDGTRLHVRRMWDKVSSDKWGLSSLPIDEPHVISAGKESHPAIRAAAAKLKTTAGIVVTCKVQQGRMLVMRSHDIELPDRERPGIARAGITAEEFTQMARSLRENYGRPPRFPINTLGVGESLFVSSEQEPRAVNLRVFCHYHGQRLGWKFSVRAEMNGHRLTRVA